MVWWVSQVSSPDKRVTFFVTKPAMELGFMIDTLTKPQAQGETFPDAFFPTAVENQYKLAKTKTDWAPGRRLPYFFAHDFFCLSNEAIGVFEAHDLGDAQLRPVTFYEHGGTVAVDEPVKMLVPANPRRAFDVMQSPKVAAKCQGIPALLKSPNATRQYGDDDLAVREQDAIGTSDVWIDPGLSRTFFVSDRLKTALDEAGLAADFGFRRARLI